MEVKSIADSLKEGDGEMELRDLTSEPYTIRIKYHEGASRIGSDIHGVMCDLAASETVELKKGEKKIIPLGVSMKLPDGYFGLVVPRSSTGERSAGASTAEGRTFRDANGKELHVGDYVIDEFGECFCVMGLNEEDGATAAYADLGNSRTSLECAPCLSLKLDERPHDCDGVPIEVGDVLYQTTFEGKPIGSPMEVEGYIDGTFFVKGHSLPLSARMHTHREPDSFEAIARDAMLDSSRYVKEVLGERVDWSSDLRTIAARLDRQQADLLRRMREIGFLRNGEEKQ